MEYPTYLIHYGIPGQKWGVRRWQNEDGTWTQEGLERRKELTNYGQVGGTIKEGTELYRISMHKNDPTFNNKKYVSTSKMDNAVWEDEIVNDYKEFSDVYSVKYKTIKDIKVAPEYELGKRVMEIWKKDPDVLRRSVDDVYKMFPRAREKDLDTFSKVGSYGMAVQSELGNMLVKDLLKSGYGAVADVHGWNTDAYDPLIILDPDNKIRRTKVTKY